MTTEIIIVLSTLVLAIILFFTEMIRVDITPSAYHYTG
jgi:hypothetical protein